MDYDPRPFDTSDIKIPAELDPLLERLAENTHDVWARTRIGDGWTYGPNRNDERKEHPCLVSYASLPEEERKYDRQTASETIKAILHLGYTIRHR